jgi:DNA-binding transcriptional ArsR family regulator
VSLQALPGDPFDALGDPHRRAIVELLRGGDRSVRELADELPISRPAVSRHLRLLKEAGLERRDRALRQTSEPVSIAASMRSAIRSGV